MQLLCSCMLRRMLASRRKTSRKLCMQEGDGEFEEEPPLLSEDGGFEEDPSEDDLECPSSGSLVDEGSADLMDDESGDALGNEPGGLSACTGQLLAGSRALVGTVKSQGLAAASATTLRSSC